MKRGKLVVASGIIILTAGMVFHLQGQGVIGPESSFMYTNPKWITYGTEIFVIGMIILGIGSLLIISKKG